MGKDSIVPDMEAKMCMQGTPTSCFISVKFMILRVRASIFSRNYFRNPFSANSHMLNAIKRSFADDNDGAFLLMRSWHMPRTLN